MAGNESKRMWLAMGGKKGVAASDKSIDAHTTAGDEDESVQWIMKQTEDEQPTIDGRMAKVSSAAGKESKMTVVGDGQGKGVAAGNKSINTRIIRGHHCYLIKFFVGQAEQE